MELGPNSCEFGYGNWLVLKQAAKAFFLALFGALIDLILVGNDIAEERDNFVVGLQFDHSVEDLLHFDQDLVGQGIARLETDLKSGVWEERFGYLRSLDALDAGYRLLATR